MKSRFVFGLCGVLLTSAVLLFQAAANQTAGLRTTDSDGKAAKDSPALLAPQSRPEGKTFFVPTVYWGVAKPPLQNQWDAVFAGEVLAVESRKEEGMGGYTRRFKAGKLKVERVFLDSPDGKHISPGDIFEGESFEGLRRGDKAIVFNSSVYYEGARYRADIEGTNTRLGIKIKSWNDPIVAAVEKTARCTKTSDYTPEGHKEGFSVKRYDCTEGRDKLILENKELVRIWRRYDPQGFRYLLDFREMMREEK